MFDLSTMDQEVTSKAKPNPTKPKQNKTHTKKWQHIWDSRISMCCMSKQSILRKLYFGIYKELILVKGEEVVNNVGSTCLGLCH